METHYRLTIDADVIGAQLPDELLYRLVVDTAVGKSTGIVRGALKSRIVVTAAKLVQVAMLEDASQHAPHKKKR